MGSERFEVESEAWYRAVAEGRVGADSDRKGGQQEWLEPGGRRAAVEPPPWPSVARPFNSY